MGEEGVVEVGELFLFQNLIVCRKLHGVVVLVYHLDIEKSVTNPMRFKVNDLARD